MSAASRPDQFRSVALLLVVISTLIQGVALLGVVPIEDGTVTKTIFGTIEMALIAALLINGWLIRDWTIKSGQSDTAKSVALLCFLSLLVCAGGDFVNRNYFGIQHGHGSSVQHSYLADSVWFFAPGYAVFVWATIKVSKQQGVSSAFIGGCMLVAGALGALSFADLYTPDAGAYVSSMTGGYAMFISIVGVSSVWLVRALGWGLAYPVAIGAVMATVADALIGNFWIYREGFYPAISHVNWILYFASQALVQQFPLQVIRN